MVIKPHAESCDRNRGPILEVIRPLLEQAQTVLEIGSGTGQHAVWFARHLPHLVWHSSDLKENHTGIRLWLYEAGLDNTPPPLTLDVSQADWPDVQPDAVISINTAHIMHWPQVEQMFAGVARLLPSGGSFLLYGPFNYNGRYTSDSNERFDAWLKDRDPQSGIRDFEALDRLAGQGRMVLQQDIEMPANNRILHWRKG